MGVLVGSYEGEDKQFIVAGVLIDGQFTIWEYDESL